MVFQTEYEFTLPRGFVDSEGNLHKQGTMRLATAADEILPMKDPRVEQNPVYLTVIVLSRVIVKLGSLATINPKVIEQLFSADLSFLQHFYEQINRNGSVHLSATCPRCEHQFEVEMNPPGEE
ncbi:MAG: phage tail assembly protein [Calditrichia bacterium]